MPRRWPALVPRLAPAANVLPAEYRRSNSRAVFIPTAILGALVLLLAGASLAYSSWSEKQYLASIKREIAKLEPERKKAEALDKQAAQMRARAILLEEFRKQTRKDLDALNELTQLIEPPAWTQAAWISRATPSGWMAKRRTAAALVQILDASPLFERSETLSVTRGANGEAFQIRTTRRPGNDHRHAGPEDRDSAGRWRRRHSAAAVCGAGGSRSVERRGGRGGIGAAGRRCASSGCARSPPLFPRGSSSSSKRRASCSRAKRAC